MPGGCGRWPRQPAAGVQRRAGRRADRPAMRRLRHFRLPGPAGHRAGYRHRSAVGRLSPPAAAGGHQVLLVLADQVQRWPSHRHFRLLFPRAPAARRLSSPPGGCLRLPVRAGAGARGSARPHPPAGLLRRIDRAAQPQSVAGPVRAGHRPRRGRAQARGGAVPGPGPLQAGQRHAGASHRRRCCARSRCGCGGWRAPPTSSAGCRATSSSCCCPISSMAG